MFNKSDLIKLNNYLWEIPKSYRKDMLVPARIYITEKMLDEVVKDRSLNQLVNLTTLPGIVKYSLAMPDIHEGYGAPIGGVFATKLPDGIISPGSVGYDINCGVRLLKSKHTEKEIRPYLERLIEEIFHAVPSGLGKGGKFKFNITEMDRILGKGIEYLKEKEYATEKDIEHCESGGCLKADPCFVSDLAKKRGRDQVGTLGSGNHFVEVQE
ncbi:MAG: RtcB family protein, partial [Candidatus Pacebacteria bacterium]|nr:RtcB family protein [Candidatus Paceibacterota bacterium]